MNKLRSQFVVTGLVVAWVVGTYAPGAFGEGAAENRPEPPKALQGTWRAVLQESKGKFHVYSGETRFMVAKDHVRFVYSDGLFQEKATARVIYKESASYIDLTFSSGDFRGKTVLGIYKIEDDRLYLCFADPGDVKRPRKFGVGSGGGKRYIVFKKMPEKSDEKEKERKQGRGEPAGSTQTLTVAQTGIGAVSSVNHYASGRYSKAWRFSSSIAIRKARKHGSVWVSQGS